MRPRLKVRRVIGHASLIFFIVYASCPTSMIGGDLCFWPLIAEQVFLQLPEVYKSFEDRPVVCKSRSYTSTAQWHWPSGDRVFTDVNQFRSVTSTNCWTSAFAAVCQLLSQMPNSCCQLSNSRQDIIPACHAEEALLGS